MKLLAPGIVIFLLTTLTYPIINTDDHQKEKLHSADNSIASNEYASNTVGSYPPPFGPPVRNLFLLAPNYTNINHGSFGSVPREVIEARRSFEEECESNPDIFLRQTYKKYLNATRKKLANYLNAQEEDLVFIENASAGVNAILRSLRLKGGDILIEFSTAYSMVTNTLNYLAEFNNNAIRVITIPVVFPGKSQPFRGINNQTLLQALEAVLIENQPSVKLVSVSHITSVPAAIFPIKNITAICKKYGVMVLVDGAHTIGQIPLDLKDLAESKIDFYITNVHKWAYGPKGTAVLWTSRPLHDSVIPTVISSSFDPRPGAYLSRFEYTGTRDYSSFCAITAALSFRERIGDQAIYQWNYDLAHWAESYLASLWNTETLLPPSLTAMMTNVRLPDAVQSENQMTWLQTQLVEKYNTYAAVYVLKNPETLLESYWVRLSAQIFLDQSDFQYFGNAVLQLLPLIPPSSKNGLSA